MCTKEFEVYTCEYWSCDDPAAIDSPVCLSHEYQFERENWDDCPSCNQLKEVEFSLCGDCDPVLSSETLLEYGTGEYWGGSYDRAEGDNS